MNARVLAVLLNLAALPLTFLTASCARSSDQALPRMICGTQIDPDLTRALVSSRHDLHEFSRVDRSSAVSAPCVLLSGRDPVINLHFWWADGPADLREMAEGAGTVSRVTDARKIAFRYEAVVGTDGAIAASRCMSKTGDHFALTLQLPQIKLTDQSHRKDIEKFMRAYFPATLRTLGCGGSR
ncbi:hypothetical protein ABZ865_11405 [Streptomyces sp. NPDC047085]|uniref:hypothetical protein n=1 Tax=Streptomyces sp. NPDC047085 TaxID=3155140 RepID=UPI0033DE671E